MGRWVTVGGSLSGEVGHCKGRWVTVRGCRKLYREVDHCKGGGKL